MAVPGDIDDLSDVDLTQVDLSHLDLEAETPIPWRPLLTWTGWLGSVALLLWLPNTLWYRQHQNAAWVSLGFGGSATWLALFTAQQIRKFAEDQAPSRFAVLPPQERQQVNWLAFAVGLGLLGMGLGFGGRGQDAWNSSYGAMAAVGAIVSATIIGRWILIRAEHARQGNISPPRPLPEWVKNILPTLVVLLIVGLMASKIFLPQEDQTNPFLGSAAMLVGLFAAAWLYQRMERRIADRRRYPKH